MAVVFEIAS